MCTFKAVPLPVLKLSTFFSTTPTKVLSSLQVTISSCDVWLITVLVSKNFKPMQWEYPGHQSTGVDKGSGTFRQDRQVSGMFRQDRQVSGTFRQDGQVSGTFRQDRYLECSDKTERYLERSDKTDRYLERSDKTDRYLEPSDKTDRYLERSDKPDRHLERSDETDRALERSDKPDRYVPPWLPPRRVCRCCLSAPCTACFGLCQHTHTHKHHYY